MQILNQLACIFITVSVQILSMPHIFNLYIYENLNVSDFNPHVAEAWMETVRETVRIAKQLHIPVLNMHLSRGVYFTLPDERVYLFDEYSEQYLQSLLEFREECGRQIGSSPIRFCVENSSGYTAFQRQALALLLESPVFALTFDIGHNHCVGGGDETVILQHTDRLCHFHFHDALGQKDHLPLGTGEIDPQVPGEGTQSQCIVPALLDAPVDLIDNDLNLLLPLVHRSACSYTFLTTLYLL